jgi:hypothetical protein
MLGEIGVLIGERVSGYKYCCRCCPPELVGVDGI